MSKTIPIAARAARIQEALARRYPITATMLDFGSPWELLVATVLAAQCTDARVNTVTPGLFRRWPGAEELAQARQDELEECIHSTGFFRNKARNLIACAKMLMAKYGGKVPQSMEELVKLPGLARKTANVVLFGGFGINAGIAVDTHVGRISRRLELSLSDNPVQVEKDLMPLFPREEWGKLNLRMVAFGREICKARKPLCDICEFMDFCPTTGPLPKRTDGARPGDAP